MISSIVSRLVILFFGTLYPAYASYKAVRTKDVKEYVKWMMYWIVFALFTCAETFTDVFLSFWFPFYYEIKIFLVIWLLSPATKGSSILYRKFVHPMLSRREQDIDEYIAKAKERGYHTVLHLGTKGVNYATTVIMQTAIKGGGGLVQQLRRSYSLSDLSTDKDMADVNRNSKALSNVPDDDTDEADEGSIGPRLLRPRGYSPRRSASGSGRVEMYFPEVDVDVRQHTSRQREPSIPLSHIRSSEDVSSGYSSAEPLYAGHHAAKGEGLGPAREPLLRTASVGSTRSMRPKGSRGGVVSKRTPTTEDSERWSNEEADFSNEEEYSYVISTSLPSQLASIPHAEQPLTQTELFVLLQELHALKRQAIDHKDSPKYESIENECPIMEAKLENDCKISSLETGISETVINKPIISENESEIAVVDNPPIEFVDEPELFIDAHANIQETGLEQGVEKGNVLQADDLPLKEDTFVDADEEVHGSDQEGVCDNSECLQAIADSDFTEHSITTVTSDIALDLDSENCMDKSDGAVSDDTLVVESVPNDDVKHNITTGSLSEREVCKISSENDKLLVIPSLLEETLMSTNTSDEPVEIPPGISINPDELATSTAPSSQKIECDIPPSSQEIEFEIPPSSQNIECEIPGSSIDLNDPIESTPDVPTTLTGSSSQQINSCVIPGSSIDLNDPIESTPGELAISNALSPQQINELEIPGSSIDSNNPTESTPDILTAVNALSPHQINECKIPDNLNESTETLKPLEEPCSSVQSELFPLPSTSVSSTSPEKRDTRSGKYNKRLAPTPPGKSKECSSEETLGLNNSTLSSSGKENLDVEGKTIEESPVNVQTAVTARLVLQPGIVKSFGSDTMGNTNQKFISSSPKAKRKNASKAKQKGSAFSRLLVMPKNQLGHFASFLPFWGGSHDTKDKSAESVSSGSSDLKDHVSSVPANSREESASKPPLPPSRLRTIPMPSCSLEYLPYVGNDSEYDAHDMGRERSYSISDFKVRDMSHSPPVRRSKQFEE